MAHLRRASSPSQTCLSSEFSDKQEKVSEQGSYGICTGVLACIYLLHTQGALILRFGGLLTFMGCMFKQTLYSWHIYDL